MSNETEFVRAVIPDGCSSQEAPKETSDISIIAPGSALPATNDLRVAFFNSNPPTEGTSASDTSLPPLNHAADKFFSALHPTETTSYMQSGSTDTNLNAIHNQDGSVVYYEHDVVLNQDENIEEGKNIDLLLYRCNFKQCNFQSPEKSVVTDHSRNYHGIESAITNTKHKEFQCDLCQMKFTVFANMQRHRMSHLGVRPFECKVCNKKFTRNDHLMEHIVRQHSKQRPYKCPFCIKSFSVRPSLKNHLASDHSGIPKDKVCRVCGFRASTVGGAKIHYTNTHLRNSSDNSTSATEGNAPMEQAEEVNLSCIPQNFDFGSQEISVPTSTGVVNNELTMDSSPTSPPLQSFRRYSSMQSLLHLPSCSTLTDRPIGVDTSRTNVSSSNRDANIVTLSVSERSYGDNNLQCSSSDLKQEPIEMDSVEDSLNSCSSTAATQPTSTMEASETNLPLRPANMMEDEEEEDTEVSNHMSLGGTTVNYSRRLSNNRTNTDEDTTIPRPARIDRKPILSSFPVGSSVSKYPDWRNQPFSERTSQRSLHNRDQGESKVTTSVGTLPKTVANQPTTGQSEDDTDSDTRELKPAAVLALQDNKPNLIAIATNTGGSALNQRASMATEPPSNPSECNHCGIIFPDSTLYFLHRGLHSDSNPWKCNYCGEQCNSKYDFYAHVIRKEHN